VNAPLDQNHPRVPAEAACENSHKSFRARPGARAVDGGLATDVD
jgi:hypothetical protein